MIRIGFVGVGSMGQCAHLRNYATLSDCRVVAIAELREQLGRRVAARYGVPRVYRDHEEMLAAEQLDAIVAAQSFTRHGSIVPSLLKAGVPVFIEKPLAASVEVGERIVDAVRRSGTWIMLGYHKRSDPATMYAKTETCRLNATGELGRQRYVRLTMPSGDWIAGGFHDLITTDEPAPGIPDDAPPPDMTPEQYASYVSFVNYFIHQVNLLRHLLGEPYAVTYADPAGRLLCAETASGLTGVIEMDPFVTTLDWNETALVSFEHGYISVALPAPLSSNRPGRVTVFRDPGDTAPQTFSPTLPWVHAMRQQAMNFLRAVRGEIPPLTDAAEALEDLRIARDYLQMLQERRADAGR